MNESKPGVSALRIRCIAWRWVTKLWIVMLVGAMGTMAGCAALGLGGINLISVEEEWQLGRQIEQEIAQEMPVRQDSRISRIGNQMASQTELSGRPWRFYVIEQDEVNAFNAPGGLVYIYRGLINTVASEQELAGVIAHEVGHGAARHGTQRLTRQYGISVLANVVLGGDPGILEEIVASLVAGGAMAQFSQQQEYEADRLGIRYLSRAGYDPRGLVSFFETLIEMRERQPGTVEQFFATHPPTPDRIERAEAEIRRVN
ncbi:MAG: M48 family metallopeptidase [Bacteroidota bacterium]